MAELWGSGGQSGSGISEYLDTSVLVVRLGGDERWGGLSVLRGWVLEA